MLSSTFLVLALFSFSKQALASPQFHPGSHESAVYARNYVSASELSDSYDFVIAGGGLAGLVLASRLSEDGGSTVLVIEAGDTGDAVSALIDVPSNTYYNSVLGSPNDWAYKTVAQVNASSRILNWPRGKVLGGSSAVNGMYLVRPSEDEINQWSSMIAQDDSTSAASWGWDQFFEAMKKSETFTPPQADVQSVAGITYNISSHGSSGPLHSSYPGYMVPMVSNWLPTLENANIASSEDANGGQTIGSFIACSSINPSNWTRSYSKSAYIDPLPPRSNLHILVSTTVTRIVFSDTLSNGNLVATGVEFATSSTAPKSTVSVNKEAILSSGVVGSAQILQLSGIGPADVLQAAGVPMKFELPGVGQHIQDHLAAGVSWQTSQDTQGTIQASGSALSQTAEFQSFINSATAYVNGTRLLGADALATLTASITGALSSSSSSLVPTQYPEVVEGYQAIYNTVANNFLTDNIGLVELLLSINAPGQVVVQAAIQHPFSQGRIYINSASAFDYPVIDPQYFSHFADVVIMREGLKLARAIGQTSPLKDILGTEVAPGNTVNTDEEWEAWLRANAATEFHPTASCAMLPKSQGGVVNAKLQVYGTSNVRVADASVYPVNFASHLGAPTYGLAEQAANIIRAAYTTTTSSSSAPTQTGSNTITSNPKPSSAGFATASPNSIGYALISILAAVAMLC